MKLSPLPIVNLDSIATPQSGMAFAAPTACAKVFPKGQVCRQHYERLSTATELDRKPVQCPYGFCSYAFRTHEMHLAFTGIVPYPRLGGENERQMAKKHPNNKIALHVLQQAEQVIRSTGAHLESLERQTIERQSVALHEIRKLNRSVKQAAERLCMQQSSADPDQADPQLVKIWKSSELMSMQFDVIELLANESLFTLPLNTVINVYRIFDKCTRIYRPGDNPGRLLLRSQYSYTPEVRACDKTFHMIPTVLIENALKYSSPESVVSIDVRKQGVDCVVHVRNEYLGSHQLTDRVFERGVRLSKEKDGSGNGLHLARLVAKQHNAWLRVSSQPVDRGINECVFTLIVPEVR